jgi:NAD-dependent dihydropyrimidine dehydrogenase PreA subunit
MPVLINFKICDNSKDCFGISTCKRGAFHWDERKHSIAVNKSKCVLCGKCEDACAVHAIFVAKTPEEAVQIQKQIDADPRKTSDLFVDRYGAEPVDPSFVISPSKFKESILESSKPALVELFSCQSIQCLLYSIPLKELFKGTDIVFRKIQANSELQKKYRVKKLPSLLFFNHGKLVGKIEGYYDEKQKEKLQAKVSKILKKIGC